MIAAVARPDVRDCCVAATFDGPRKWAGRLVAPFVRPKEWDGCLVAAFARPREWAGGLVAPFIQAQGSDGCLRALFAGTTATSAHANSQYRVAAGRAWIARNVPRGARHGSPDRLNRSSL
ncbi:MAG TPA: hypothetical protein VH277_19475 [Gemmatimonadaceae bacterium]|nr:hypothetical protein [Gemmatimonadaceae bacterium]